MEREGEKNIIWKRENEEWQLLWGSSPLLV